MAELDLNLLRTFVRVCETGSVTVAAAELGVSQPTVSQAVARLRRQLGDQLFVRAPRGVRPTELAEALYRDVAPALLSLEATMLRSRGFDPRTSTRTFRLCLTDLGESAMLPLILRGISAQAPEVAVEVVPMDVAAAGGWLRAGRIDLAVATVPLGPDIAGADLLGESYVCLMRSGHPLAGGPLTVEAFRAARHAVVTDAVGHRAPEEAMARQGIERRVGLRIPRFAGLAPALERTDLLAVVPARFARGAADRWDLAFRALPFTVPEVTVRLWHRQGPLPPAVDWLRRTTIEAVRGEPARA